MERQCRHSIAQNTGLCWETLRGSKTRASLGRPSAAWNPGPGYSARGGAGSVPLKRCLLIFNDLIFDSRVVRGMPSLAAVPERPVNTSSAFAQGSLNDGLLLERESAKDARLDVEVRGRGRPGKPTFIH